MVKEALVVSREILFKEKYFEGFMPIENYDYMNIILKNHTYSQRSDKLEHNAALQQIIPYVWIVNPKTKKVFVYKRSNNEKYTEMRLWNKISCGVGGHIEREDGKDPVQRAMMRELQEEVTMKNYPKPRIVGYLNYDSGDVEKVHFGIVAIAETTEQVKLGDGELAEGDFMAIEEIDRLFGNLEIDVENWTKLSWPFIKQYILDLV